jgi:hypothetical protein
MPTRLIHTRGQNAIHRPGHRPFHRTISDSLNQRALVRSDVAHTRHELESLREMRTQRYRGREA